MSEKPFTADLAQLSVAITDLVREVEEALERGGRGWLRLNIQAHDGRLATIQITRERNYLLDGKQDQGVNSRKARKGPQTQ